MKGVIKIATSKKSGKVIDEDQKKILATLAQSAEPTTGKEISSSTGIDPKLVSKKLTDLKSMGLVDTPIRCKYSITETGAESLKN